MKTTRLAPRLTAAALLMLLAPAAPAAVYDVTLTDDSVDPTDGEYSLVEAIAEANVNPGLDQITFSTPPTTTANLVITGPVEFKGPVRIRFSGTGTLMKLTSGASGSTFEDLVLHEWDETRLATALNICARDVVINAHIEGFREAVLIDCGEPVSVSVSDELFLNEFGIKGTLTGDSSVQVQGILYGNASVVDLVADECGPQLTIEDSTVLDTTDTAISVGGCIELTLLSSILRSNDGPLLHTTPHPAGLDGTLLYPVVRILSTELGYNPSRTDAPLIFLDGGVAEIAFTTITANSGSAPTVMVQDGALTVTHSIISGNRAPADLHAEHTSLEGHWSLLGKLTEEAATLNLDTTSGSLVGVNPGLDGVIPGTESPARNGGDPSLVAGTDGVPEYDARPGPRILEGVIDIGAYEHNLAPEFDLQRFREDFLTAYRGADSDDTLSFQLFDYLSDPEGHLISHIGVILNSSCNGWGCPPSVHYDEATGRLWGLKKTFTERDEYGPQGVRIVLADEHNASSVTQFKFAELLPASSSGGASLSLLSLILLAFRLHRPRP